MSEKQKNVILIVFGFIVFTLAICAIVLYIKPTSQKPGSTPIETLTPYPTVVMAATNPPPTLEPLPPTWTPTPKMEPTVTVELQVTPTIEPTIYVLQAPTTPFSLTGYGSTNTRSFILPAGRTTITWKYSGSSTEAYQIQSAYTAYKAEVNGYYIIYKIPYDYYTGMINDALDHQDAFAALDAKQKLQAATDQYNQDLANAKSKYEQALASSTTTFKVVLKNTASDESSSLISANGTYTGSTSFIAKANIVYFFNVQSSGNWEISVTPKK